MGLATVLQVGRHPEERIEKNAANPQAQMWKGLALTRKKKLSIRIPQRQFIGESEELNEKIEKKITEKIFNILTS